MQLVTDKNNTRTEVSYLRFFCQKMIRAESISVRAIRMQCQLVTRTEGMSVRVIRMLGQLVGLGSVERANVKSDVFF